MCIKPIPSLTCSLILYMDWQTNVKHIRTLPCSHVPYKSTNKWRMGRGFKPKTFCNYSFNMMLDNSWTQKALCPNNVYQAYTRSFQTFSDKDIVHTSQYQPTNAIGEVCSKCVCNFC